VLRLVSILVVPVLVATALSADARCGSAYVAFVERLGHRADQLSGQQLANIHRKALRIFDACDSGHMENAEVMFRRLERG
jgi:hypothetical protein